MNIIKSIIMNIAKIEVLDWNCCFGSDFRQARARSRILRYYTSGLSSGDEFEYLTPHLTGRIDDLFFGSLDRITYVFKRHF